MGQRNQYHATGCANNNHGNLLSYCSNASPATLPEDHCTCPGNCKFHGKCVECVIIHRGHSDHLPHCFRNMVNERLEGLSELSEHSFKRQPKK